MGYIYSIKREKGPRRVIHAQKLFIQRNPFRNVYVWHLTHEKFNDMVPKNKKKTYVITRTDTTRHILFQPSKANFNSLG